MNVDSVDDGTSGAIGIDFSSIRNGRQSCCVTGSCDALSRVVRSTRGSIEFARVVDLNHLGGLT